MRGDSDATAVPSSTGSLSSTLRSVENGLSNASSELPSTRLSNASSSDIPSISDTTSSRAGRPTTTVYPSPRRTNASHDEAAGTMEDIHTFLERMKADDGSSTTTSVSVSFDIPSQSQPTKSKRISMKKVKRFLHKGEPKPKARKPDAAQLDADGRRVFEALHRLERRTEQLQLIVDATKQQLADDERNTEHSQQLLRKLKGYEYDGDDALANAGASVCAMISQLVALRHTLHSSLRSFADELNRNLQQDSALQSNLHQQNLGMAKNWAEWIKHHQRNPARENDADASDDGDGASQASESTTALELPTRVHARTRAHMHACTRAHTPMRTCVHARTHMHTHMYTHMHTL